MTVSLPVLLALLGRLALLVQRALLGRRLRSLGRLALREMLGSLALRVLPVLSEMTVLLARPGRLVRLGQLVLLG